MNSFAPMSSQAVPATQKVPPVDSLLSKSGLLGVAGSTDDSGGLFDEVDRDEQKQPEPNNMNKNIENTAVQSHQQYQTHNHLQNGQNPNPAVVGNFVAGGQNGMVPQPQLTNQIHHREPAGAWPHLTGWKAGQSVWPRCLARECLRVHTPWR